MERDPIGGPLVLTWGDKNVAFCKGAGLRHVHDASVPGAILDTYGNVKSEVDHFREYGLGYVLLIRKGEENWRDWAAVTLGDEWCRWAYWPNNIDSLRNIIGTAKPMWSDEVSTMDDIPEPGDIQTYESGFGMLDQHGFRFVLPAFVSIIGPYGSGKSVFLRQLLVNLYRLHGWKFLISALEEKVKPRFQRDLRRYFIKKPQVDMGGRSQWSEEDIALADGEIRKAAVFLRRKRNGELDFDHLVNRIEFAARVHNIRVAAVDPFNEVEHRVPKGENKTDYMGRCIMRLKQLADDYNLLMIVCAHPPKDGTEKRMAKGAMLTLADGADTAHWGNKSDIGLCVWRPEFDKGPTMLHGDKLKDYESMGRPFLALMTLNPSMNAFRVDKMGFNLRFRQGDEE